MLSGKQLLTLFSVMIVVNLPGLAAGERPRPGPGRNNALPHYPGANAIVVQPATIDELLQCLIGPNVEIANAVLNAAPGTAGLFTGGSTIVGLDEGIVLSSGNIVTLVGPNLADETSYDNGYPGDADLDGLIPGYTTYDATILEFDFSCDNPTVVSFQYVFASEEYNEWVGSPFNDVFGFFLNGTNIAVSPAVCSGSGLPVAINTVNCEEPYNPPNGPNCDCYRNNDLSDGGGLIDTEMDGLTQVFYANAVIQPGDNHIKLAIADAGDPVYDSNVILTCQSFTCGAAPSTGGCCFGPGDDDCFLLSEAQCHAQGGSYLGDGVPCTSGPCEDWTAVDDAASAVLRLVAAPSPSPGVTTINYSLEVSGFVTIDVFDAAGSRVRRLAQGSDAAGPHAIAWDGRDESGRSVASGTYFVRLTTGRVSLVERFVILR
jgi:flagellar hook capping protein FlgD